MFLLVQQDSMVCRPPPPHPYLPPFFQRYSHMYACAWNWTRFSIDNYSPHAKHVYEYRLYLVADI